MRNGVWDGKDGHCWYLPYKCLGKIEDTEEEKIEKTGNTFIPKRGEDYCFLVGNYNGNNTNTFRIIEDTWTNSVIDYGLLSLGNVFRTKEEALKYENELLKKLEKLNREDI